MSKLRETTEAIIKEEYGYDRTPEYRCEDCHRMWSEYDIYAYSKLDPEKDEPICPDDAGRCTGPHNLDKED